MSRTYRPGEISTARTVGMVIALLVLVGFIAWFIAGIDDGVPDPTLPPVRDSDSSSSWLRPETIVVDGVTYTCIVFSAPSQGGVWCERKPA